jgi:hypothetical protein
MIKCYLAFIIQGGPILSSFISWVTTKVERARAFSIISKYSILSRLP